MIEFDLIKRIKYVVIVWLGMPDNDPTKVLTGASAARPLALRLANVLEMRPAIFKKGEKTQQAQRLIKKTCPQLISLPKDGAVIYQEGNVLPVRSNLNGTVWYLNGKRAMMNKQNIIVPTGGFHQISAVRDVCKGSVFVEVRQ